MKKLRSVVAIILYASCFLILFLYRDTINSFIIENYIIKQNTTKYTINKYSKVEDYNFVYIEDELKATSKKDLINIIYTILDSGNNTFTFYCDDEYTNCQKDIEEISKNNEYLNNLNNFVHPYNSYNKLFISSNDLGKITISIEKLYSEQEINYINNMIKNIESSFISEGMTDYEKIKNFHDYIANTTKYDSATADNIKNDSYNENKLQSHKANGVLYNHLALCSGYTDIMSIYLNHLGINNYKIANNNHIWNALYLDEKWYHLDLTWDDPVTSTGTDIIIYDFFIIDNDTLYAKDTIKHVYDELIYSEIATSQN